MLKKSSDPPQFIAEKRRFTKQDFEDLDVYLRIKIDDLESIIDRMDIGDERIWGMKDHLDSNKLLLTALKLYKTINY